MFRRRNNTIHPSASTSSVDNPSTPKSDDYSFTPREKLVQQFGSEFTDNVWVHAKHKYFADNFDKIYRAAEDKGWRGWEKMNSSKSEESAKLVDGEENDEDDDDDTPMFFDDSSAHHMAVITDELFGEDQRQKYDYNYVAQAYEHMSFFGVMPAVPEEHQADLAREMFPLVTQDKFNKLPKAFQLLAVKPSGVSYQVDRMERIKQNPTAAHQNPCINKPPARHLIRVADKYLDELGIHSNARADLLAPLKPGTFEHLGRASKDGDNEDDSESDKNALIQKVTEQWLWVTRVGAYNTTTCEKPTDTRSFIRHSLAGRLEGTENKENERFATLTLEENGWECCSCVRSLIESLLEKRHKHSSEPLDVEKIFEAEHYEKIVPETSLKSDMAASNVGIDREPSIEPGIKPSSRNEDEVLKESDAASPLPHALNPAEVAAADNIRLSPGQLAANSVPIYRIKDSDVNLRRALREIRNCEQTSILHLAAASGDVPMFKFLTQIYVDEFDELMNHDTGRVNIAGEPIYKKIPRVTPYKDIIEETAFQWYPREDCTDGHPNCFTDDQCDLIKRVQLELKKMELVITHADNFGRTCLHLAVQHGKHKMVQHIIDLAEDIFSDMPESKIKENRVNKPLQYHINRLQDKFRSSVLAQTTRSGETPLHFAARYDKHQMVFLLLYYAKAEAQLSAAAGVTRWDSFEYMETRVATTHAKILRKMHMLGEGQCARKMKKDLDIYRHWRFRENAYRPCPCKCAAPFLRCHGSKAKGLWHSREVRQTGKSRELAPEQCKVMLDQPLTMDQEVYRDMKDSNGQTALHIAAKMDRDTCCSVLLDLGADPAHRDAEDKPAIYYMTINVPVVAARAMEQFNSVERSTRRAQFFVSTLLPTQKHLPELYFYSGGNSLPAGHSGEDGPLEESAFITQPDENFHEDILDSILEILENDQPLGATEQSLMRKVKLDCINKIHQRMPLKIADLTKLKEAGVSTDTVGDILSVELAAIYIKYWWRRFMTPEEYKVYWETYFTQAHRQDLPSQSDRSGTLKTAAAHHKSVKKTETKSRCKALRKKREKPPHSRDLLDQIVKHKRMNLLVTPVVDRLVESHWRLNGTWGNFSGIIGYFIFLLLWTTISLLEYEENRRFYGIERIIVECIGVAWVAFYIGIEIQQYNNSRRRALRIKNCDLEEGQEELLELPPTCSDFYYTFGRIQDTCNQNPLLEYFMNVWNVFDICGYTLLLLSQGFQLWNLYDDGQDPDLWAQFFAVRFLSIGLVFSWLKLLKYLRVLKDFGPFVVMLGNMFHPKTGDIAKFGVLFLDLLIPFAVAFTILYGGTANAELTDSYGGIGNSIVSVFRMTVVDYDFAPLKEDGEWTASIIVILWIFLSGIIFLNLFIAMMSTTFENVQDAGHLYAAMERATAVVQEMRDMHRTEIAKRYADILTSLDFDGPGDERFSTEVFDDEDDTDDANLPNLRLEIIGAANNNQERLYALQQEVDDIKVEQKKMRKVMHQVVNSQREILNAISSGIVQVESNA